MSTTLSTAVFACPVCGEMLPPAPGGYVCANGHQFDVAREGYVNLLLAQHRRSKDPGYSKEMIAGRRDFFDAGHYERLADGVAERVRAALPRTPAPVVVDAGCGEGYYLRRLRTLLAGDESRSDAILCGLDISKHGIRMAAKRDLQGIYAVAGTYRMPILPERVDVLVTHFSPISAADFRRVVRPDGVVLVGGPGEGHLFSFKELLYARPTRHEPEATLADKSGFELIDTSVIRYPLSLRGPGQVANLLLMTPFFWSVDDDTWTRLAALDALDTEVDVVVHAYRRTCRRRVAGGAGSGGRPDRRRRRYRPLHQLGRRWADRHPSSRRRADGGPRRYGQALQPGRRRRAAQPGRGVPRRSPAYPRLPGAHHRCGGDTHDRHGARHPARRAPGSVLLRRRLLGPLRCRKADRTSRSSRRSARRRAVPCPAHSRGSPQ